MQGATAIPAAQAPPNAGRRVGPLTLRLVIALALFPIVPGSTLAITVALDDALGSPVAGLDSPQLWMLLLAFGVTFISLFIWRACVVWTAGRLAGTVVATAVPIAQALLWQPLWSAGCVSEEILLLGQSVGITGVWVWLATWGWWGWGRLSPVVRRRIAMSDSARRVLLSLGTIPVVVGVYLIAFVFCEDVVSDMDGSEVIFGMLVCGIWGALLTAVICLAMTRSSVWYRGGVSVAIWALGGTAVALYGFPELDLDSTCAALAGVAGGAVAVVSWILVWRPVIERQEDTVRITALMSAAFLGCALTSPLSFELLTDKSPFLSSDWLSVVAIVLPMIFWGGWMMATMLTWRFRDVPHQERSSYSVHCRSCGYSLRGLYGTRCPECGDEPTLDQLLGGLLGVGDA
ncbi:MAG: hypothetical protein GY842_14420 [bacterium]|nr:hypothetical protein [bacterium]